MTERLDHPAPAQFADLEERHLMVLDAGSSLARVYFSEGSHPATWRTFRHYGPTLRGRFDHHQPPSRVQERGVMYAAPGWRSPSGREQAALKTCLAEVFRDQGTVNLVAGAPKLVIFTLSRPLRLLDLADSEWLTESGGNAAISSGSRIHARRWARAIADRYGATIDGVFYAPSNLPAARAAALWEPAVDALPGRPRFNKALADGVLRAAVETYAFELRLDLVTG
ncbi:MAG: hypothetical protein QM714_08885 [Nocardioides sp.]|uniref:hypothetical protein n=1 Tax=Nocardioides sp. TaxID=35761 RepID=UPI0039E673DF